MTITTLDVLPKSIILNKTGDIVVGGTPTAGQNPRGKILPLGPSGYVLGSNGVNPVWLPYSLTPGTVTSVTAVSPSLDLNISNPTVTTTGTIFLDLSPTGVLAGTYSYPVITVDTKGRITQITSNIISLTKTVSTKTSDYTIKTQEDGYYFTNSGASGSVVLSLPEPSAGASYKFFVSTAQNIRVLSTGSSRIHFGIQTTDYGGYIESSLVGNFVSIVALNSSDWYVEYAIGDWGLTGIVTVTSSGNVSIQSSTSLLILNKTVSEVTTVYLPSSPFIGERHTIKDLKGNAASYNITVNGNGLNIDANPTFKIDNSGASYTFTYDGTRWIVS